MKHKRTLRDRILKITHAGILTAITAGLGFSWTNDFYEESQRQKRIQENLANFPRVPLGTPEVYIDNIREAIRSGRIQPGSRIKAPNKDGTRVREFVYEGCEDGFKFTFLREYAVDANNQPK